MTRGRAVTFLTGVIDVLLRERWQTGSPDRERIADRLVLWSSPAEELSVLLLIASISSSPKQPSAARHLWAALKALPRAEADTGSNDQHISDSSPTPAKQ
uniref:Uncharacterized protein n=1 Tax=Knipowitschia caucasica TaxID=637954 RepID=A0AAV2J1K3_KNICA